jgi:hypothetical protein
MKKDRRFSYRRQRCRHGCIAERKVGQSGQNFIMIKKQRMWMVPCGIPYIFGTLESSQQNNHAC